MHRIDTPTAQADKFGPGKNGFTGGNPQTGRLPTALNEDFFDAVQEEMAGLIEAAGVVLDKAKHNQLLTAIKALFLSRSNPFGDIKADGAAAVALALTNLGLKDAAHVSDWSQSLTDAGGLVSSGWRRSPDGFIEQFISVNVNGNGTTPTNLTVPFPIPFPNQVVAVRQPICLTADPSARFAGIRSGTVTKSSVGMSFITATNNNFYISVVGR